MNQKIADTQVKGMSLNATLANNAVFYSVDYYQRSYAWGEKEVYELMNDLFVKFHESYSEGDNVRSVPSYKQYFLGSYVLSRKNDTDYIIDGQQRLTTLTLLFMAIAHLSKEYGNLDRSFKALNYVYSNDAGEDEIDFKISIPSREETMKLLLQEEEHIPTKDDSCDLLVKNYRSIFEYISLNLNKKTLPVFFQWLTTRVLMVSITAYDDTEAYTIFESMNDRGKSLTNLDMLKGLLLSTVNEEKIKEASEIWKNIESEFDSTDEFDKFMVNFFRAKWARNNSKLQSEKNPNIGKKAKNDWAEIQQHYHRFAKENKTQISINNQGETFILLKNIQFYANLNSRLKSYRSNFDENFRDIFKLDKLNLPYVDVLLFALISPNDKDEEIKIKIITKFMDIRVGILSWNMNNSLEDANMSYYLIGLLKRLRETKNYTNYNVLSWFFYKEIESKTVTHWTSFDSSPSPKFSRKLFVRRQTFYMLANFSDFLESNSDRNIFAEFYESKDKYEIEHMLASNFEHNKAWYQSEEELNEFRDNIGGLGLLRKSVNASFNNMSYSEKLPKYIDQNTYLASLSESMYKDDGKFANKPSLNRTLEKNPRVAEKLKSFETLDSDSIIERDELCLEIAKILWNKEDLRDFIDSSVFAGLDEIKVESSDQVAGLLKA